MSDYNLSPEAKKKEEEARKKDATDEATALAQVVIKRWEQGDGFLRKARKDYRLNLAFYQDQQWITWDNQRGQAQVLPARFSESERVRVTDNKIRPALDTLMGTLSERDLVFEGDATDADDQSIRGSQLAEAILEAARQSQGWENIRRESLMGTLLGGCSAISVEWNHSKGERLWVNEANNQITGTGEVVLNPMTIDEFTVEPGSRSIEAANWWIGLNAVPCEQVREFYGLEWTPAPDVAANTGILPVGRNLSSDQDEALCAVYVMYERPNAMCKEGRCVAVVNGIAVKDGKWKFPFNHLNLALFRQATVPAQWHGSTFTTSARPVQVLLNAARSNIAEHMKMASNVRMWVPYGSIDDISDLTDEAGEIVQYHAEPNAPTPDYKAPPPLSNSMIQYAEVLEQSIADIMHVHDVARGVAPGDRNSGLALSILAEKNNTPLGPMTHDQSDGWSRIGTMVLKLYAGNVKSSREAIIMSKGGIPQKYSWQGSDLRGQTNVRVPIDAVAPYTRAQMLAQLQNLQQLNPTAFGTIPHERIIALMGLSSTRELAQGLAPDISKAHRENDRMSVGEVQIPAKFDDHAKHIAEHNAFRKTTVFEMLPKEIQELFEEHIVAHETFTREELMGQATMNAIAPGLGALPQANDPMGSAVPEPFSMNPNLSEEAPLPAGPPQ